ncbi:hypothetical protein FACS189425_10670 [Clostridia bacterium]|nr:hypothetical protein FACS189425_10670 [Clostridia bacterium]
MTAYERLQVAPSLNYNAPLEPTPPQALQLLEQMEGIPNLVVHNLYADNGAIANLVVNRLRTDWEKPFKYLNGDTGDCHYHYIHGITDDWLEADYKGPATEQWKNADGEPIWWKDGVVGGKFTTAESSAPVIVYKYSEHVKASMGFREIIRGGAPMSLPTITLGEGDGTGRSKGFIFKDHDGLNIEFLSNNGQTHWIRMQHDGIEIKGLKRAAYAAAAGEIQWFGINDAAFNLLAEPDPDEIQSVQTTQGGT